MSVKPLAVAGLLLSTIVATCALPERRPLKLESLVGDYVLRCDDPGVHCDPDKLALRADGKYSLRRMPPTGQAAEEEGSWRVIEDGSQPRVLLADRGLPVEVNGGAIRLLVDDDLGEYYVKSK